MGVRYMYMYLHVVSSVLSIYMYLHVHVHNIHVLYIILPLFKHIIHMYRNVLILAAMPAPVGWQPMPAVPPAPAAISPPASSTSTEPPVGPVQETATSPSSVQETQQTVHRTRIAGTAPPVMGARTTALRAYVRPTTLNANTTLVRE